MANIIQLKIEGIGREGKGDPLGKTSEGKIVFVRGNKNLKKGDFVKCEIKKPSYKYSIANFIDFVKEGPKAEGPMSGLISGGKVNGLTKEPVKIQPVKTPQQKELEKKLRILKEVNPVDKVLNNRTKRLLRELQDARKIVHHILDSKYAPVDAIRPLNSSTYYSFCQLNYHGIVSIFSAFKWCFIGEEFFSPNGEKEFVRRDDIRIAMDKFLSLISK